MRWYQSWLAVGVFILFSLVIFHDLHTMLKDARDGAPLACGTWAMRAARWDMPAAEQERIIRAIEARKAAETWLEWL